MSRRRFAMLSKAATAWAPLCPFKGTTQEPHMAPYLGTRAADKPDSTLLMPPSPAVSLRSTGFVTWAAAVKSVKASIDIETTTTDVSLTDDRTSDMAPHCAPWDLRRL